MTEVTDADIELVEAITEAWSDYQDLWFKSGRRKDACQRYWDAKELAARHREAAEAPLRAEVERLREALEEIMGLPGEINPSNYDHDDVCELNRQFCYGYAIACTALGARNDADA